MDRRTMMARLGRRRSRRKPGPAGRRFHDGSAAGGAGPRPVRRRLVLVGRHRLTAAATTTAAWRDKPTYYAVSTADRTINPDQQRFMAKRMGAHVVSLGASHLSLISHAPKVAELIAFAARSA